MTRGRYGAWVYVVFAFLMEIGLIGGLFALAAFIVTLVAGLDNDTAGLVTLAGCGVGGVAGIVLAYFMFRDRWKCIEAFSSRFCSGLMNLSIIYVPWVALVYANVRGVQKLFGK